MEFLTKLPVFRRRISDFNMPSHYIWRKKSNNW